MHLRKKGGLIRSKESFTCRSERELVDGVDTLGGLFDGFLTEGDDNFDWIVGCTVNGRIGTDFIASRDVSVRTEGGLNISWRSIFGGSNFCGEAIEFVELFVSKSIRDLLTSLNFALYCQ